VQQFADRRTAAPDAGHLGYLAQEAAHGLELVGLLRARDADDDAAQVRHLAEHLEDPAQSQALDLRVQAGQDQRHRALARVVLQLALHPREIAARKAMERGDEPTLMEVAHVEAQLSGCDCE